MPSAAPSTNNQFTPFDRRSLYPADNNPITPALPDEHYGRPASPMVYRNPITTEQAAPKSLEHTPSGSDRRTAFWMLGVILSCAVVGTIVMVVVSMVK
jgi:hypothetical protein